MGLRLRVERRAALFFETEFNGQVGRYLHADATDVAEDEPFVEVDAMKMIMSLRSSSAGRIYGSAGELLATRDLADTSKVQMVKPFGDAYQLSREGVASPSAKRGISAIAAMVMYMMSDMQYQTMCSTLSFAQQA